MSESSKNFSISYEEIKEDDKKGFLLAFSVIGDHKINQDSYKYKIQKHIIKLALADGLGSSKYSNVGSDIATEIVINNDFSDNPNQVFLEIFEKWKNEVGNEDLYDYDTTLKYLCILDNEVVFFNVGDGITFIENDSDKYIFSTNNEFLTETDSLCSFRTNNSNFYQNIKFKDKVLVITYTDGIDQFLDREKISDFGAQLVQMYKDGSNIEEDIKDWIKTWDNHKYYDDKTILVLYVERRKM